ncbi:ImmA/IrrE family metallo-endopeptidase [Corynebacterium variabile]|uniref:ImmA/IrrE family metallo-endopeptidase n=1 Tax=Corynebacterium variabile TaxID=1727 RepID=UPI00264A4997|nr:ImmA/IrrE family metallo-endopeptidase [Corynebacterium variabile]MDN6478189.1 ImmA/IrrE family metallo-endopeptidase [Corynebacterium variabile]
MREYKTTESGLTNDQVQQYAKQVGNHFRIYNEDGYADVDAFIKHLGGKSEVAEFNESLTIDEDTGNFTIYLPSHTSARRDRFTKSNELGHYFLHFIYASQLKDPDFKPSFEFGRGETSRAETEANVFASALLMPEDKFREWYNAYGQDIDAVARKFDVSPRAAEVRASVLGL